MQRRGGSGEAAKRQRARRRKARNASNDLQEQLDGRTRELEEALQQQTATSEVLKIISSSAGQLEPVFRTILANATRLCEATFGSLLLTENNTFRRVAIHNAPLMFEKFH